MIKSTTFISHFLVTIITMQEFGISVYYNQPRR